MSIIPKLVQRSWSHTDDRWYETINPPTKAGIKVTEANALKYLTLLACVTLVAGDIAKLPLSLYKKSKSGKRNRLTALRLDDLIHNAPTPEINSFSWREAMQCHLMLWGNAYCEIIRAPYTGEIIALTLLENPGSIDVIRSKKGLVYRWKDDDGNQVIRYKRDILHIPGFGFNGLVGLSMVQLAREAIGLGLSEEEFGATFFSKGTHPAGFLSTPPDAGPMNKEKREEYSSYLKKNYAGLGASHGIMLLPNGEKYQPLTIPPNDAQFLESRAFQKDEICGIYHVPPHKIAKHGANSNYNNLEQENQNYVDSCLSHWVARWETCISQQLLSEQERRDGIYASFKLQGLLRGDSKARGEFYKTLWMMGLPLNEILSKEDENPVKDGDTSFVPANMLPASMAKTIPLQKKVPEPIEKKSSQAPHESRSIVYRDRLVIQYQPLINRSVSSIIGYEIASIKAQLEARNLDEWLVDFYRTLPDYIVAEITPVLTAFASAVRSAADDEIGHEVETDIQDFITNYVEMFAQRHSNFGLNQLKGMLDAEIAERVGEWGSKRAENITENEIVRSGNAVYQYVVFAAGMSTVWHTRGAHTCPYCKTLNGKRISKGGHYVGKGEVMTPDGDKPITNRGIKRHPPLHKGCDCFIGII